MNRMMIKGQVQFRYTYLLSFCLIALYAVLINLKEFGPGGRVHWVPQDFVDYFGLSDAASYLRLGIDLAEFTVTPANYWIVGLWPPGMAITDAIGIMLPGSLFVWMLLINAASISLPVAIVLSFAKKRADFFWLGGLTILYLAQPSKFWSLSEGAFMSDGLGSNLLLSSLLIAQKAVHDYKQNKSPRRILELFAVSGILLSASMHYRFAFWPVALAILLFASLTIASSLLNSNLAKHLKSLRRGLAVFIISFLVSSAPWTFVVTTVVHPGNPTWSTGEYQWAQRWMTDQYLQEGGAGWLVEGGANWACKLDTKTCELLQAKVLSGDGNNFSEFRDLALKTGISNPLELLALKAPILAQATITPPGASLGADISPMSLAVFTGILLLTLTSFLQMRKTLGFVYSTVVLSSFATLLVAHVESRYMIPIFDLFIFGVVLNFVLSRLEQPRLQGRKAAD
jgi:hypothetical protein